MSRCICGHTWDDHATWCYSSGCPCHFNRAPQLPAAQARAALLAELAAGVKGLAPVARLNPIYTSVSLAAVLDLIHKAGER